MYIPADIVVASHLQDIDAWLRLKPQYQGHIYPLIVGHVPEPFHAEIIRPYAPQRKIHFIFSKDDTGALCDLKLASYIRNKPLKISYQEYRYHIHFENKNYQFERLSLNALEKASCYNFRIRTHKPKKANTYYEQLYRRHPA
jgi:hypothetical protein